MLSSGDVLLACVLLLASAALLTKAECPLRCKCFISRNQHYVDCREKNLEAAPSMGDDTYEIMNFTRNRLRKVENHAFESFPRLLVLDISYNFIVELGDSAFKGLGVLEMLDLSNNSLVYVSPHFLDPCPGIQWLSLAKNEYIGREIAKIEEDGTPFLDAVSLRTLVLASCQITVFPPWILSGLPGLETLDISNNRIKVLPVLSMVSVCRLKMIDLDRNPFACDGACNNSVTKQYFDENKSIKFARNVTFCGKSVRRGCSTNRTEEEEGVRNKCLLQKIPEPLPRKQPRSVWVYIGGISIGLVALIFLALLFNGIVSTCRNSESPPSTPGSPHSRAVQQELKEILSRSDNLYKSLSKESFQPGIEGINSLKHQPVD